MPPPPHDAIIAQDPDAELDLDPALATCVQQSLRGPRLAPAPPDTEPRPGTVSAFGMHLHSATTVDARDRKRLERVCRYLLRPPFAHDAVEALADGRVRAANWDAEYASYLVEASVLTNEVREDKDKDQAAPGLSMRIALYGSKSKVKTEISVISTIAKLSLDLSKIQTSIWASAGLSDDVLQSLDLIDDIDARSLHLFCKYAGAAVSGLLKCWNGEGAKYDLVKIPETIKTAALSPQTEAFSVMYAIRSAENNLSLREALAEIDGLGTGDNPYPRIAPYINPWVVTAVYLQFVSSMEKNPKDVTSTSTEQLKKLRQTGVGIHMDDSYAGLRLKEDFAEVDHWPQTMIVDVSPFVDGDNHILSLKPFGDFTCPEAPDFAINWASERQAHKTDAKIAASLGFNPVPGSVSVEIESENAISYYLDGGDYYLNREPENGCTTTGITAWTFHYGAQVLVTSVESKSEVSADVHEVYSKSTIGAASSDLQVRLTGIDPVLLADVSPLSDANLSASGVGRDMFVATMSGGNLQASLDMANAESFLETIMRIPETVGMKPGLRSVTFSLDKGEFHYTKERIMSFAFALGAISWWSGNLSVPLSMNDDKTNQSALGAAYIRNRKNPDEIDVDLVCEIYQSVCGPNYDPTGTPPDDVIEDVNDIINDMQWW